MKKKLQLLLVAAALGSPCAFAQIITNGFTFAVASSGGPAVGTHFHSNTGGAFGNPAGKAEVGRFFDEEVRGLSEYDLTGLSTSPTAFVTFNVFKAGGLFTGANDFPFTGSISIFAYAGNNTEDISDFQAPSTASIGSFTTTGLLVGNILSFDVTSAFNSAILASETSFGIRLQVSPLNDSGAWTFDNFRLTTTNETTPPVGAVPEPGTYGILGTLALGVVIGFRHYRQRKQTTA